MCVRFEIEFNSHTSESGQKKFSYLFYGKILRFISLHCPECVYNIYSNIQMYICVTHSNILRSCCALLHQLKILDNFHIVYFLFLFFLCTYLSQFADIIVGGQEGRQKLLELLLVCSHFDFLFFLRSEKPANFHTQSSRDEAASKKSRTMGNAMPGCQNTINCIIFIVIVHARIMYFIPVA